MKVGIYSKINLITKDTINIIEITSLSDGNENSKELQIWSMVDETIDAKFKIGGTSQINQMMLDVNAEQGDLNGKKIINHHNANKEKRGNCDCVECEQVMDPEII